MKKLCLCLLLCLLAASARADEIFGAGFPSVTNYMADDGTILYHIPEDNALKVFSALGDYSIDLPREYSDIWQIDYADPQTFTLICKTGTGYTVVPIQDKTVQPAVALPEYAVIIHRPLDSHVYYHTRDDSRLCRFNWKTGEETTLLPRVGGLYHADRWNGSDYLVFTLPNEKGEYRGYFYLMAVDANGGCSEPLALAGGMENILGPLCATPWGNVLIAGTDNNASTLYCYSASGSLLWQVPAECRASRLIPSRAGFTVVGHHRGGPVTRREIDMNGQLLDEHIYKAFVPGNGFPVVDGEVYYAPLIEEDPRFIPLE